MIKRKLVLNHAWRVLVLIFLLFIIVTISTNRIHLIQSLSLRVLTWISAFFVLVIIIFALNRGRRLFRKRIQVDSYTHPAIVVTIIIAIVMLFSNAYPDLAEWASENNFPYLEQFYPQFITVSDRQFFINFIEWFGIFYGFIISGVLIKVFDQFSAVESSFNREVEAVSILYGNIQLLNIRYQNIKLKIVRLLDFYVTHVLENFVIEHHYHSDSRAIGDKILREIRMDYHPLINSEKRNDESRMPFSELYGQLNNLINLRCERISVSGQNIMIQPFRLLTVLISIMWLLPFYFLTDGSLSAVHQTIIVGVTFLVIFVLYIIEDLDDPFSGLWMIGVESWHRLHDELTSNSHELEISFLDHDVGKQNTVLKHSYSDNYNFNTEKSPFGQPKEQITNVDLQAEVGIETTEINKSVSSHKQNSTSYSNTKTSIVGSILVSISIIIAAIILKKRE